MDVEYPLITIKKKFFFQKGHFLTKGLIPGRFIFLKLALLVCVFDTVNHSLFDFGNFWLLYKLSENLTELTLFTNLRDL